MKAILEIPDEEVEIIKRNGFNKDGTFSFKLNEVVKQAIRNGVILPDNATNGDVIKAMFPQVIFTDSMVEGYVCTIECHLIGRDTKTMYFNADWWNAPYEGGTT